MYFVFALLVLGLLFFGPESGMQFSRFDSAIMSTASRQVTPNDINRLAGQLSTNQYDQRHANTEAIKMLQVKLSGLSLADLLKISPSHTLLKKELVKQNHSSLTPNEQKLHISNVDEQLTLSLINDILFKTRPHTPKFSHSVNHSLSQVFQLALIDIDLNSNHGLALSQKQISEHYKTYKHRYLSPESFQLNYVYYDKDDLPITKPAYAEIKAYFNKNIKKYQHENRTIYKLTTASDTTKSPQIPLKAKRLIEIISKQHNKKVQFTTETVTESTVPQPLLIELNEKGITAPNTSPNNIYFYYTQEASNLHLNQIVGKVTTDLINEKKNQAFSKMKKDIDEAAYTSPNSLNKVAQLTNKPIVTSPKFSLDGSIPKPFHPDSLTAIHTPDMQNENFNSPVVEPSPGKVIVYRINKQYPSRQLTLQEAQPIIHQELQRTLMMDKVRSARKMKNISDVSQLVNIPIQTYTQSLTDNKQPFYSQLILSCAGQTLCVINKDDHTYFVSVSPSHSTAKKLVVDEQLITQQLSQHVLQNAEITLSPSINNYLQGRKNDNN